MALDEKVRMDVEGRCVGGPLDKKRLEVTNVTESHRGLRFEVQMEEGSYIWRGAYWVWKPKEETQ